MTATEMEDVLKNLDRRLTNVEQILPTLATKDDLKAFATKEDLKAFATKEDLKAYATKEDLKAFASRVEMQELFADAKRYALVLFERTQEQLEIIATHVADISQRLPPRR
jgi:hypothetical protein